MGILTSPQLTVCDVILSLTIRLFLGSRPVFKPEYAHSAPFADTNDGRVCGSAGG
jgi:hypothetical protein